MGKNHQNTNLPPPTTQRPSAPKAQVAPAFPECICKGNLRNLVKKCEPLIDKQFNAPDGTVCTFFGIVIGSDDYYYGMSAPSGPRRLRLLSCVGRLGKGGHDYVPTVKS